MKACAYASETSSTILGFVRGIAKMASSFFPFLGIRWDSEILIITNSIIITIVFFSVGVS